VSDRIPVISDSRLTGPYPAPVHSSIPYISLSTFFATTNVMVLATVLYSSVFTADRHISGQESQPQ
jgi:hypothetical protein